MRHVKPVADVVEEIFQSILATPKHQRRLRSKTFWAEFGFKMRTHERVEQVKQALHQRGVIVNLDDATFGTEDKEDWIILTFVEQPRPPMVLPEEADTTPIPTPDDAWFDLMAHREFDSEREVEYYFVVPLLEHLGYAEEDFAIGYPVQMYEGVKKVNKEADFVLFRGHERSKDDALLVVEAKRAERVLTEDAVGQARGYSLWLTAPYYLVTNGDELRVYLFRGAVQADVQLMVLHRAELREQWPTLYKTLNKEAVIEYKSRWQKVLGGTGPLPVGTHPSA